MKIFSTLLFILFFQSAFSQTVLENYDDFNIAITRGQEDIALTLSEKILSGSSALSPKQQAILFYGLANIYENGKKSDLAIEYYEKSLQLEPNYYVPHLALAYIFISKSNLLVAKINSETKNILLRQKYINQYNLWLKKAVPHFEFALACDPNEQVMSALKNAYKSLKDNTSILSLDKRLKEIKGNCVSVLIE